MSPILVRPVREQLEHDRIIRLLHGKSRRKYDAGINPGAEQNAPGRHRRRPPSFRTWCCILRNAAAGWKRSSKSKPANRSTTWKRWPNGPISPGFAPPFTCTCLPGWSTSHVGCARTIKSRSTEVWSYHSVGDDVRFTADSSRPRKHRFRRPLRERQRRRAESPAATEAAPPAGKAAATKVPNRSRCAPLACGRSRCATAQGRAGEKKAARPAKTQVIRAFSQVFPRQAGLRVRLPGSHADAARQAGPNAGPVLVSDASRREDRPQALRR